LHFLSNEKIPLAFRQLMDKAMEASGLTSAWWSTLEDMDQRKSMSANSHDSLSRDR
jgi:hypothetical protein